MATRTARLRWPRRVWWILNYHDISDDPSTPRPTTPVAVFRTQLDLLCESFQIITLQEGFARLDAGEIDGAFASITFDDGYAGVVRHAYPALERRRAPGTVFVCGSALTLGRELWDIALRRLILAGRADAAAAVLGVPLRVLVPAIDDRLVKRHYTIARGEELTRLAAAVTSPGPAPLMTMAEAQQLDPAILAIGNHTWSHAALVASDETTIVDEIGRTETTIESLAGRVRVLAVPFGTAEDVTRETVTVAQRVGLRVLSAYGGYNRNAHRATSDVRRTSLDARAHVPWDLSVSAIGYLAAASAVAIPGAR
jgi:peptidoglycan/xylan/chitin deacetylase (PgdA/CDA1 family)